MSTASTPTTGPWLKTPSAASGELQMNADGNWTYDAQGAYDYLNAGEQVELNFNTMTDNHGASDSATVTFCIDGVGDVLPPPPPPPPPTGNNFFPVWGQDISHFTLVFDQTQGDVKPVPRAMAITRSRSTFRDRSTTTSTPRWPMSSLPCAWSTAMSPPVRR